VTSVADLSCEGDIHEHASDDHRRELECGLLVAEVDNSAQAVTSMAASFAW
jgi:hypothetical protein